MLSLHRDLPAIAAAVMAMRARSTPTAASGAGYAPEAVETRVRSTHEAATRTLRR